MLNYLSKVNKK